MLTCRACDVASYPYLRYVLTELPKCVADADATNLLAFNYANA